MQESVDNTKQNSNSAEASAANSPKRAQRQRSNRVAPPAYRIDLAPKIIAAVVSIAALGFFGRGIYSCGNSGSITQNQIEIVRKSKSEVAHELDQRAREQEAESKKEIRQAEQEIHAGLSSATEKIKVADAEVRSIQYSNPERRYWRGFAQVENCYGMVTQGVEQITHLKRAREYDKLIPSAVDEGASDLNLSNAYFSDGAFGQSREAALEGLEALNSSAVWRTDLGRQGKMEHALTLRSGLYGALGRIEVDRYEQAASDQNRTAALSKAEKYFKTSYSLAVEGRDQLNMSGVLQNLAVVCFLEGHFPEAERYGRKAWVLNEGKFGNPYKLATNIELVAECEFHRGRSIKADQLFRQSILAFGPKCPKDLAMTLVAFVDVLIKSKDYSAAEEAEAFLQDAPFTYGWSPGHDDRATIERVRRALDERLVVTLDRHPTAEDIVRWFRPEV